MRQEWIIYVTVCIGPSDLGPPECRTMQVGLPFKSYVAAVKKAQELRGKFHEWDASYKTPDGRTRMVFKTAPVLSVSVEEVW